MLRQSIIKRKVLRQTAKHITVLQHGRHLLGFSGGECGILTATAPDNTVEVDLDCSCNGYRTIF